MPHFTRRRILTALAALPALPHIARAAPRRYQLATAASRVGFQFTLNGIAQRGTMPVGHADILVDPENLGATRVDVSVDVSSARTPFKFATRALKSKDVLNAAQFPAIRFVSTRIRLAEDGRLSGGARIEGQLTLRGQTRPIALDAALYRARGSEPKNLDRLSVRLTGDLSRAAFGASGYANLVRDRVALDILAVMRAI